MTRQTDVARALRAVDFGRAAAEEDKLLWETFVETDLWNDVLAGRVDLLLGAKGSGKSAFYSRLFRMRKDLAKRQIYLIGAANVGDDPILGDLPRLESVDSRQFQSLWKHYTLALIADEFRRWRIHDRKATHVIRTMEGAGLLAPVSVSPARELFERVRRHLKIEFAVGVTIPLVTDASIKVSTQEPTATAASPSPIDIAALFRDVGEVLAKRRASIWILIDRLDSAFPATGSRLESTALLSLVQSYLDLRARDCGVTLKVFLRDDIWQRITHGSDARIISAGVVQPRYLRWTDEKLVSLLARRLFHDRAVCDLFGTHPAKVAHDPQLQRELVARALPTIAGQADDTVTWLLESLRDGYGRVSPRELVVLLENARQTQAERIGLALTTYQAEEIFERPTLADACVRVSEDRLFVTLWTEYPEFAEPIQQLRGSPDYLHLDDLGRLWHVPITTAVEMADQLTLLGFFEKVGHFLDGSYRVSRLYQPALAIWSR